MCRAIRYRALGVQPDCAPDLKSVATRIHQHFQHFVAGSDCPIFVVDGNFRIRPEVGSRVEAVSGLTKIVNQYNWPYTSRTAIDVLQILQLENDYRGRGRPASAQLRSLDVERLYNGLYLALDEVLTVVRVINQSDFDRSHTSSPVGSPRFLACVNLIANIRTQPVGEQPPATSHHYALWVGLRVNQFTSFGCNPLNQHSLATGDDSTVPESPEAVACTRNAFGGYLPIHFGARFSMNAVRPSL